MWGEAGLVRAACDSSLNVMDSTPLPCDVHAHLMLKWPIRGTIVFQSCQGKVQNRAHFLLPGVITMPQFTAQSIHPACTEVYVLYPLHGVLFKDTQFGLLLGCICIKTVMRPLYRS